MALVARRRGDAAVEAAIAYARATLEEATDRTRRLMFELRPAVLHEHGVAAAVRLLADQTARETGADARVEGDLGRHDPVTEELLYRSAQEALANARRHAHAATITVALEERADTLTITVEDDGCGFDIATARDRPDAAFHLGLDTLVERIQAAGGHTQITSTTDNGTRISFALPITDTRAATLT